MTIKQTHTSADGQERTCTAEPGQCPINSNNPSNPVTHNLYIDGEKQTPQQQTQIINLHKLHAHLQPKQNLTNFHKTHLTINENGEWDITGTPEQQLNFLQQSLSHPNCPHETLNHYLLPQPEPGPATDLYNNLLQHIPTNVHIKTFGPQLDQHIQNGVPLELAFNLSFPNPHEDNRLGRSYAQAVLNQIGETTKNRKTIEALMTNQTLGNNPQKIIENMLAKNPNITPEHITTIYETHKTILYVIVSLLANPLMKTTPQNPKITHLLNKMTNPNRDPNPTDIVNHYNITNAILHNPTLTSEQLTNLYQTFKNIPFPNLISNTVYLNMAERPNTPTPLLDKLSYTPHIETKTAVASHPNTAPTTLIRLSQMKNRNLKTALIHNQNTPHEALNNIYQDPTTDETTKTLIQQHPNW